jgi:hypothetical protein
MLHEHTRLAVRRWSALQSIVPSTGTKKILPRFTASQSITSAALARPVLAGVLPSVRGAALGAAGRLRDPSLPPRQGGAERLQRHCASLALDGKWRVTRSNDERGAGRPGSFAGTLWR